MILFQKEVIDDLKREQQNGEKIDFAGDGKFDSPGLYNKSV